MHRFELFRFFHARWLPRPLPRLSWDHFDLHFRLIVGATVATIRICWLLFRHTFSDDFLRAPGGHEEVTSGLWNVPGRDLVRGSPLTSLRYFRWLAGWRFGIQSRGLSPGGLEFFWWFGQGSARGEFLRWFPPYSSEAL